MGCENMSFTDKVKALYERVASGALDWNPAGFDGNLSPGDNTLQEILDEVDNFNLKEYELIAEDRIAVDKAKKLPTLSSSVAQKIMQVNATGTGWDLVTMPSGGGGITEVNWGDIAGEIKNQPDVIREFTVTINTMADLLSIDNEYKNDKTLVKTKGFWSVGDGGEGSFYWDANKDKTEHNGGSVIDSTKTLPNTNDEASIQDWFVSTNTNKGCWVRAGEENADIYGTSSQSPIMVSYAINQYLNQNSGYRTFLKKEYKAVQNIIKIPSNTNLDMMGGKLEIDPVFAQARVDDSKHQIWATMSAENKENIRIVNGYHYGSGEHMRNNDGTSKVWNIGIDLFNCRNLDISNNVFEQFNANGLAIDGDEFAWSDHNGISNSRDIRVVGNTFKFSGAYYVDYSDSPPGGPEQGVGDKPTKMLAIWNSQRIFYRDNKFINSRGDSMFIWKSKDIVVQGNFSKGSHMGGIFLAACYNVNANGNISLLSGSRGFTFETIINSQITNNQALYSGREGFRQGGMQGGIFNGNVSIANAQKHDTASMDRNTEISFNQFNGDPCRNLIVTDNYIVPVNTDASIYLDGGHRIIIRHNLIKQGGTGDDTWNETGNAARIYQTNTANSLIVIEDNHGTETTTSKEWHFVDAVNLTANTDYNIPIDINNYDIKIVLKSNNGGNLSYTEFSKPSFDLGMLRYMFNRGDANGNDTGSVTALKIYPAAYEENNEYIFTKDSSGAMRCTARLEGRIYNNGVTLCEYAGRISTYESKLNFNYDVEFLLYRRLK